ncbi:MAG: hypothetical protein IKT40_12365 [Bacilli bacterium]|nr:hypothetical protein [Bacilli bacterium]
MIKMNVTYDVVCDNCGRTITTLDYYPNKEQLTNIGAVKTKRHLYCSENCKHQKMIEANNYINNK